MSLKFSDIVKQYDGEGDFCEWVRKVEIVAKLQKIAALEEFLPLFLSGGAFAVYEGLEDATKKDYNQLKLSLVKAFSINQFRAFEEFMTRKLLQGESVDVYLSDLRRLSTLVAGSKGNEEWIKCAFVNGLAEETRRQLMAACALEKMNVEEIVERARTLVNVCETHLGVVAEASKKPTNSRACFICHKEGHMAKNCRERRMNSQKSLQMKCFRCEEMGHISYDCPKNFSKNY